MKQLGVGLVAAILIDAAIVRAVPLPAAMKQLGKRKPIAPRALRLGCPSSITSREWCPPPSDTG